MVTDNFKPSAQCIKAAAKARVVLGTVKRNSRKLDESDFFYTVQDVYQTAHGVLCAGMVLSPA